MKNLIFFILVLISSFCHAQKPGWLWGANAINADDDAANAITHDKQGNVYVAGSFKGVQILGNDTLISKGDNDVFLVKYAPDGQVIWARSGGSVAGESVSAIATDSSGNVYLTGHFGYHVIYPTTITDTAFFSGDSIISKGNIDIFLSKYNSDGNILWLKGYGSIYNDDNELCLTINKSQKIIFSGGFSNGGPPLESITFDNYTINASAGSMFLIKMNLNSNIELVKQYKAGCVSLTTDKYDNIYAYGYNGNNAVFDGFYANNISSGFVGGGGFIVKFDSNLNAKWAKSIGGINNGSPNAGVVVPTSLCTTADGDSYVAGSYTSCSLIFTNGFTLANVGAFEIFLAKYDTWGNQKWAKSMGGLSDDGPPFVYLDDQEHCYVTGYVRYQAFFDQDTVTCYGFNDVFLAQYDKNGNENWAVNMGGGGNEAALAIDGSADGSIYLAGSFNSDYFNYQSDNIQNSGGGDMFLVKLSKPNGIENLPESKQIVEIFPNPAQHLVHIQSNTTFDHLKIIDALGSVVTEQHYTTPQLQADIDLSGLPNNYYYLSLNSKKQFIASKMITVNH